MLVVLLCIEQKQFWKYTVCLLNTLSSTKLNLQGPPKLKNSLVATHCFSIQTLKWCPLWGFIGRHMSLLQFRELKVMYTKGLDYHFNQIMTIWSDKKKMLLSLTHHHSYAGLCGHFPWQHLHGHISALAQESEGHNTDLYSVYQSLIRWCCFHCHRAAPLLFNKDVFMPIKSYVIYSILKKKPTLWTSDYSF